MSEPSDPGQEYLRREVPAYGYGVARIAEMA